MMFRDHQLRKVLLCVGLEVAALMGAPMRPDEIEDLLRNSQQARIHFSIVREDREDSDDPVQSGLENGFSGRLSIDSTEVSP
jgi:hypothetical protein